MVVVCGPAGSLQVKVDLPDREPQAVAVICHPHPLHGGSLNNKIVHQLARTCNEMQAVSVRFNFRGVGESGGEYDEGNGELQDLFAVVDWVRDQWSSVPLWLGGFSFGGFIALKAAAVLAPERLITVAPAVNYFAEAAPPVSAENWLIVQGDSDDIVPAADVKAWLSTLPEQPSLALIPGAGHFFHGRLNDLKKAVLERFQTA